jgi:hypothetical protein
MHYPETISTVRFVADLMGEMLTTFYDEPQGEDESETPSQP